jgi:hypothetical protein
VLVDIEHLRRLPEEELRRLLNEEVQSHTTHYNVYLDELARREAVRQGERMEELTRSINRLTWVVTSAAVLIALTLIIEA